MRGLNSLALFLAASATSVVAILPHHEAHAKYAKKAQPKKILPRQPATRSKSPSKYLTNSTAGKLFFNLFALYAICDQKSVC